MKVLVTGATGSIGRAVVNNLLEKGISVIATARDEQKFNRVNPIHNLVFLKHDMNSKISDDLYTYFQKPDILIHLAWDKLKEPKNSDHTGYILENHKAFLSNLIHGGLKNINVTGTCYEYGLKEGELQETDPSAPVVEYAKGKNLLREFVEIEASKKNVDLKWIRIFNIFDYGKEGANLFSQLISAIANGEKIFNMSGGEQVRDYLTLEEAAEIIVKISLQNKVKGIINCCSGKPVVLKDFIEEFLKKNNHHIELNLGYYPYLNYEPLKHWGSIKKLNLIVKNLDK
jgi:dTDP-6-deoxy-L-talose 4-dehydrogenase (NAD+)